MTEDVVPASVLGDETEALRVVEPLHGTSRHSERSFSFGLQGCRPAPTVGFVGAVVLYRSGGSAVKTLRPARYEPVPGISPTGRMSTSRGLAPSAGPTIPSRSMRSIIRAARLYPTRSLRCSSEMEM